MGFYAPVQIVGDARKNGVEVREIDVSFSFSQNTLEERCGDYHAVRLGFRQIDGFKWADPDEEFLRTENNKTLEIKKPKPEDWGEKIVTARSRRGFTSLEDPARRRRCVSLHRAQSPGSLVGGAAVAG
jgi:error-prone DNA polymerase